MKPQHLFKSGVQRDRSSGQRRRGIATLWLILLLPAIVTLLVLVVEMGNLWVAQLELDNSLEAAALAAAQSWDDRPDADGLALEAAADFAGVNLVAGQPVVVESDARRERMDMAPPGASSAHAHLQFGVARWDGSAYEFVANPSDKEWKAYPRCVQIQATVPVRGLLQHGFPTLVAGTLRVSRQVVARRLDDGRAEVIWVR